MIQLLDKPVTVEDMEVTAVSRRFSGSRAIKPRLYVDLDGETIMANFMNRFDRPYLEYRKLLSVALEALGLPPDTKARWSQRAGCSCGCSPGFVLDAYGSYDAWITVKMAPQEPTELGVDRGVQLARQMEMS